MQPETVFLMIVAAAMVTLIVQRPKKGADKAGPRRIMRHINKRRQFMGLPALYKGDPTMPKDWTCNDVRRQEWEEKQ